MLRIFQFYKRTPTLIIPSRSPPLEGLGEVSTPQSQNQTSKLQQNHPPPSEWLGEVKKAN